MRISVVIPAYNSVGTIAEALDSVLAQDLPDLEIIVVDDCSPDDIQGAVEEWQAKSAESSVLGGSTAYQPQLQGEEARLQGEASRTITLKILRTPHNMGPAGARNLGIRSAQGEWIAFLDADDAWLPGKLKVQFEAIAAWQHEHPGDDPVFVCGGTAPWIMENESASMPDNGSRSRSISSNPKSKIQNLKLPDFAVANPVATSTVLARREVIMAAGGFDEQFRGPEDYDLWLRVAAGHGLSTAATSSGGAATSSGGAAASSGGAAAKNPRLTRRGYKEDGTAAFNGGVGRPLSFSHRTPVSSSQSAVSRQRSAVCGLQSSVFSLQSSVFRLRSAVCGLSPHPVLLQMSVPLARYRSVPGSLSMDDRRFLPQVLRVIDKAYAPDGVLQGRCRRRKSRAYHLLAGAWSAADDRRIADAVRLFVRSLIEWPFSFRPEKKLPWGRIKVAWYIARRGKKDLGL